ncbi:MAG: exonuclease domain-containing protein [Candidatus Obscuribacterales bacterium]|nr:exonuclease domain-containing protein [Candidatus Obscuribacterales bacterium]
MIVNVLDTEWSCYDGNAFPAGETAEIIEFGLSMIDLRSAQIIKRVCMPIVPCRSKISAYCTELTGWTAAKLFKQGMSLQEACRRLSEKYGAYGRLLAVDTDNEAQSVKEQCESFGLKYPFGPSTINVSTLYGLLTGKRSNLGLSTMLQSMGLQFEGRQHYAYDDSYNLGRLFLELLKKGQIQLD